MEEEGEGEEGGGIEGEGWKKGKGRREGVDSKLINVLHNII